MTIQNANLIGGKLNTDEIDPYLFFIYTKFVGKQVFICQLIQSVECLFLLDPPRHGQAISGGGFIHIGFCF